jgi:hypothetical protein
LSEGNEIRTSYFSVRTILTVPAVPFNGSDGNSLNQIPSLPMAFEVGQSSVIDNTGASSPSDSLNAEIWGGLVVVVIPASGSAIRKGKTRVCYRIPAMPSVTSDCLYWYPISMRVRHALRCGLPSEILHCIVTCPALAGGDW